MPSISAGDAAPPFDLPSDLGGRVSLESLKGQAFILYFYPKDDTPGCTTQACDFSENLSAFESKGYRVFGVSKDSLESHAKFRAKHGVRFPLLSDPSLDTHRAYGAFGEKKLYGKVSIGVIRTTVAVAADGRILAYQPACKAKGNAERTLRLI